EEERPRETPTGPTRPPCQHTPPGTRTETLAGGENAQPLPRLLVGGEERFDRQFRQRDVERRAEHRRRGNERKPPDGRLQQQRDSNRRAAQARWRRGVRER